MSILFIIIKYVVFFILSIVSLILSLNMFVRLSSKDYILLGILAVTIEFLKWFALVRGNTIKEYIQSNVKIDLLKFKNKFEKFRNSLKLKSLIFKSYFLYAILAFLSIFASYGFVLTVINTEKYIQTNSVVSIQIEGIEENIEILKNQVYDISKQIDNLNNRLNNPDNYIDNEKSYNNDRYTLSVRLNEKKNLNNKIRELQEKLIALKIKKSEETQIKTTAVSMFFYIAETFSSFFKRQIDEKTIILILLLTISVIIEVGMIVTSPVIDVKDKHLMHLIGMNPESLNYFKKFQVIDEFTKTNNKILNNVVDKKEKSNKKIEKEDKDEENEKNEKNNKNNLILDSFFLPLNTINRLKEFGESDDDYHKNLNDDKKIKELEKNLGLERSDEEIIINDKKEEKNEKLTLKDEKINDFNKKINNDESKKDERKENLKNNNKSKEDEEKLVKNIEREEEIIEKKDDLTLNDGENKEIDNLISNNEKKDDLVLNDEKNEEIVEKKDDLILNNDENNEIIRKEINLPSINNYKEEKIEEEKEIIEKEINSSLNNEKEEKIIESSLNNEKTENILNPKEKERNFLKSKDKIIGELEKKLNLNLEKKSNNEENDEKNKTTLNNNNLNIFDINNLPKEVIKIENEKKDDSQIIKIYRFGKTTKSVRNLFETFIKTLFQNHNVDGDKKIQPLDWVIEKSKIKESLAKIFFSRLREIKGYKNLPLIEEVVDEKGNDYYISNYDLKYVINYCLEDLTSKLEKNKKED